MWGGLIPSLLLLRPFPRSDRALITLRYCVRATAQPKATSLATEMAQPNKYERQRLARIEENRRRLEELGVIEMTQEMAASQRASQPAPQRRARVTTERVIIREEDLRRTSRWATRCWERQNPRRRQRSAAAAPVGASFPASLEPLSLPTPGPATGSTTMSVQCSRPLSWSALPVCTV